MAKFVDLYIYDCSVRPVETDDVNVALIAHYSYTEYEDKFDEIYGLLSKNAVSSGACVLSANGQPIAYLAEKTLSLYNVIKTQNDTVSEKKISSNNS